MTNFEALTLLNRIIAVGRDENLSWPIRFDQVFNIAKSNGLYNWSAWRSWYDPDAGYDDDVIAFVDHCETLRDELIPLLKHEPTEPLITVTLRQALDSGRWNEFCEAVGLDPWRASPSEGADDATIKTLPLSKARAIWGQDLSTLLR